MPSRRRSQEPPGRDAVHLERLKQLQTHGGRRSPHRPFDLQLMSGSLLWPSCLGRRRRPSPPAGHPGTRRKGPRTALVHSPSCQGPATPRPPVTTSQQLGGPTRSTIRLRRWQVPCRLSWRSWRTTPSFGLGCDRTHSSSHACRVFWRLRLACGRSRSSWTLARRTASSVPAWPRSWVCRRPVRPGRVR